MPFYFLHTVKNNKRIDQDSTYIYYTDREMRESEKITFKEEGVTYCAHETKIKWDVEDDIIELQGHEKTIKATYVKVKNTHPNVELWRNTKFI